MSKRERQNKARYAVYNFLLSWATVMQDPEEDIPQDLADNPRGSYPVGITPEDIADAAKFITRRLVKARAEYEERIPPIPPDPEY